MTTTTTTTTTTRVSLRDLNEAAFRALVAHGASHGEARAAARMVLQAEFTGGGGLSALRDDLAAQPWSRTPVEIVDVADGSDAQGEAVELRSQGGNRLLREAPLAVELVTSGGDERIVEVQCAVAGTSLLDAALLEAARVTKTAVAVVIGSATERDGAGRSVTQPSAQVRLARPDGSLGVGTVSHLPSGRVAPTVQGEGVVALRDVEGLGELDLSWASADELAQVRAKAAAVGVTVDARAWNSVYAASRRYLVPD